MLQQHNFLRIIQRYFSILPAIAFCSWQSTPAPPGPPLPSPNRLDLTYWLPAKFFSTFCKIYFPLSFFQLFCKIVFPHSFFYCFCKILLLRVDCSQHILFSYAEESFIAFHIWHLFMNGVFYVSDALTTIEVPVDPAIKKSLEQQ